MSYTSAHHIAVTWLDEMQACVRARAFERCRSIFSDDVVGFGSRAALLVGLDALERDQWRHVWPRIRNFTFLLDRLMIGSNGELVWIACPWSSEGKGPNGTWQPRPGRMTAVLQRRGERWLAVHTHHSVSPERTP